MNLNNIPIKNKLNFYREESNGRFLIIPGGLDQTYGKLIDSTGKAILDLCDSQNTINDIVEILKIKFNDNDTKKIEDDVVSFINKMINFKIINIFKEDIMYTGVTIDLKNNYFIHRCGEGDYNEIVSIVSNNINEDNKSHNLVLLKKDNKHSLINSLSLTNIRLSIFKFLEEFYILRDNENKNLAIVSFSDVSNRLAHIYELSFFKAIDPIEDDIIDLFISKSICNIKSEICSNCIKIKASLNSKSDLDLQRVLERNSFNQVGCLINEFGNNSNKILLEKLL